VFRLPTTAFKAIRAAKSFAKEVGERIIHEKMEVGQQTSAGETDVFDMFCEFRVSSMRCIQTETMTVNLGPPEKRRNLLTLEEVAAQTGGI
jgi:hypothetical protein